jgi:hypothetical protein
MKTFRGDRIEPDDAAAFAPLLDETATIIDQLLHR